MYRTFATSTPDHCCNRRVQGSDKKSLDGVLIRLRLSREECKQQLSRIQLRHPHAPLTAFLSLPTKVMALTTTYIWSASSVSSLVVEPCPTVTTDVCKVSLKTTFTVGVVSCPLSHREQGSVEHWTSMWTPQSTRWCNSSNNCWCCRAAAYL